MIIIGGFRSGLFTPTEAGAVAVFTPLCRRGYLSGINVFQSLPRAGQCRQTTSVVMFLVAAYRVSASLITIAKSTHDGVRFAAAVGRPPRLLFIAYYDPIMVVGMAMDLTPTC